MTIHIPSQNNKAPDEYYQAFEAAMKDYHKPHKHVSEVQGGRMRRLTVGPDQQPVRSTDYTWIDEARNICKQGGKLKEPLNGGKEVMKIYNAVEEAHNALSSKSRPKMK